MNNRGQCHYRCSFDVENTKDQNSWKFLIGEVRSWIAKHVSDKSELRKPWFYIGGNASFAEPRSTKVFTKRFVGDGNEESPEIWAVSFSHQCSDFSNRWWQTDIGITKLEDNKYRFNLSVSHCLNSTFYGREPQLPLPSCPSVVRRLLTSKYWRCTIGDCVMSVDCKLLKEGGGEDLRQLLKSEQRGCPIVLISRDYHSNQPLLSCDNLANRLGGVALVYVSESNRLDKELEECLGYKYSCWNGMVRIYQTCSSASKDNPRRHHYFKKNEILEYGSDEVANMIVKGICRRNSNILRRGVYSIEDLYKIKRIRRIEQLKDNLEDGSLEELLELYVDENNKLTKRVEQLEFDNEFSTERIEDLESKLTRATSDKKAAIKQYTDKEEKCRELEKIYKSFDEMKELPKSNLEVVEFLRIAHNNRLVFTEKCLKSVESATLKDFTITWECLWSIATVLYDLIFLNEGQDVNIEQEFNSNSRFELTFKEGRLTSKDKKCQALRRDIYNGKTIDITPHVKYGTKGGKLLRVHFYPCHESKKIVIGHCGDHLENRTSRSIK